MDRRGPEPPTLAASESERANDSLALRVVAASPSREDLHIGDRIGRFTVLGRLGGGSMGVVYSAYDDVLDRKVAVKLVRRTDTQYNEQSRVRLVREAQAMARLSHPNVVAVYEAGLEGDEVFVAMEFIHGETLFAWAATPRTWQEVLAVYIQAARGLAAAHAAGLVHRDFKPGNVMLGSDGRVRVLDFGLVQPLSAEALHISSELTMTKRVSRSFLGQRMTHDGQVLGTPAYMSPEQLSGEPIDPKSDQFSFCAALYETLYGDLPFRSGTLQELITAIRAGKVLDPPRPLRVPHWLRRALIRGLSGDPNHRFPSMEALLAELDRRPVRWWRTIAVSIALAAATSGFLLARASDGPALCSGAESALGDAWDSNRRSSLRSTLNTLGKGFTDEVWPQVSSSLDSYADSWLAAHQDTCLASQRGEQSDLMLDRRMACLSQRRTSLDETTQLLAAADRELAVRALELIHALPPLAPCNDKPALSAALPLPPPALAETVASLRNKLARAQTLTTAGRFLNARTEVERTIAIARQTGYLPVLAEVLLLRGKIALAEAGGHAAGDMLTEAFLAAISAGDDELTAEALTLRIYARGQTPGMATLVREDISVAEAFITRLPRPERLMPLLLNNIGTVFLAEGNNQGARSYFQRAIDIYAANTPSRDPLQHAYTLFNRAVVSENQPERERRMREALAFFDSTLGSVHPRTLDVRISASMYVLDPQAATSLLARACDDLDSMWPENFFHRVRCRLYLGLHHSEAGHDDAAVSHLHSAKDLLVSAPPEALAGLGAGERARIVGYAALLSDSQNQDVMPQLEGFLADLANLPQDEWVRHERAEVELVLGLNLLRAAKQGPRPTECPEAALTALARAIHGFDALRQRALNVSIEAHLAFAHRNLAEALSRCKRDEEGASHASAADRWYREAGDGYRWRLSP